MKFFNSFKADIMAVIIVVVVVMAAIAGVSSLSIKLYNDARKEWSEITDNGDSSSVAEVKKGGHKYLLFKEQQMYAAADTATAPVESGEKKSPAGFIFLSLSLSAFLALIIIKRREIKKQLLKLRKPIPTSRIIRTSPAPETGKPENIKAIEPEMPIPDGTIVDFVPELSEPTPPIPPAENQAEENEEAEEFDPETILEPVSEKEEILELKEQELAERERILAMGEERLVYFSKVVQKKSNQILIKEGELQQTKEALQETRNILSEKESQLENLLSTERLLNEVSDPELKHPAFREFNEQVPPLEMTEAAFRKLGRFKELQKATEEVFEGNDRILTMANNLRNGLPLKNGLPPNEHQKPSVMAIETTAEIVEPEEAILQPTEA